MSATSYVNGKVFTGRACRVHCSSWPRCRTPRFLSRRLMHSHDGSAGRQLAGGWWLDYAEHATALGLAGCSPQAAELVAAS
jgi:hypothetical protein